MTLSELPAGELRSRLGQGGLCVKTGPFNFRICSQIDSVARGIQRLYGDYPLVHNSPWLRDAGYYYPDFDIAAGAAQLLQAVRDHDQQQGGYRARSLRVLESVNPLNPANVDGYAQRLLHLVGGNAAFRADRVSAA
jgi:hypothetical protein